MTVIILSLFLNPYNLTSYAHLVKDYHQPKILFWVNSPSYVVHIYKEAIIFTSSIYFYLFPTPHGTQACLDQLQEEIFFMFYTVLNWSILSL